MFVRSTFISFVQGCSARIEICFRLLFDAIWIAIATTRRWFMKIYAFLHTLCRIPHTNFDNNEQFSWQIITIFIARTSLPVHICTAAAAAAARKRYEILPGIMRWPLLAQRWLYSFCWKIYCLFICNSTDTQLQHVANVCGSCNRYLFSSVSASRYTK